LKLWDASSHDFFPDLAYNMNGLSKVPFGGYGPWLSPHCYTQVGDRRIQDEDALRPSLEEEMNNTG